MPAASAANVTAEVVSCEPPWVWWKTSSVPITTMFPSITGLQIMRFASAAPMYGAVPGPPQVGSPRISASYASNCAAVLSAHCAGVAISTVWPAATAA